MEIGVHLFDLWRYLLETEVEEVFAVGRHGARDDENAVVTAVLANGALASARLSERTAHDMQVEICGAEGRVESPVSASTDSRPMRKRKPTEHWPALACDAAVLPRAPPRNRAAAAPRRLRKFLQGRLDTSIGCDPCTSASSECTVEDGRDALRVALAAAASATDGRPVRVAAAPSVLAPWPPSGESSRDARTAPPSTRSPSSWRRETAPRSADALGKRDSCESGPSRLDRRSTRATTGSRGQRSARFADDRRVTS